jgi:two-component system, OmpR family, sensor histidine kinase SenX3
VETGLVLQDGARWTAPGSITRPSRDGKQRRPYGHSALTTALGDVSRQLRGPLAGMAILIELVEAERSAHRSSTDAFAAPSGQRVVRPFDGLRRRVVDNIRATGDPLGFKPQLIDFSEVVLEVARLNWPLAESRDIALVHSSRSPAVTSGDRGLLAEAIGALLNGVIRASPADSIVTCHLAKTQADVSVQITSNARDIDLSSMHRALRPFERGNSADRTISQAEDIDIWTARMIADQHGGFVRRVVPTRRGHSGVELSIPASWG